MTEQIIKSKKRVQQHGEVFTPSWMVDKMLDVPGIKEACQDVRATFLEPAAGDGNFLAAILERKLQAVSQETTDPADRQIQSLWALTSLYGIEYLADNLELARSRLFMVYLTWFEETFHTALPPKGDIAQSARYIIHKNIIRGNTLTKRHPETNEVLIMVEWQAVPKSKTKVAVSSFPFASLFGEDVSGEKGVVEGQLSLFDDDETKEEPKKDIIRIDKVYQLGG